MTARELAEELLKNPDAVVVREISPGSGNYDEVTHVDVGAYDAETMQYGLAELTPDLKSRGYTLEDVQQGVKAVQVY